MHSLNLNVDYVNISNEIGRDEESECLADIHLYVVDGDKKIILFEIRWDYAVLKKWLLENKNKILNEEFPQFLPSEKSIAQGISSFYDHVDPDEDALIDQAQEYRRSHGFRFALRGVKIPDIYIGKIGDKFEISGSYDSKFWVFHVDGNSFFSALEN